MRDGENTPEVGNTILLKSLMNEKLYELFISRAYLELLPSAGHDVMADAPQQLNTMAGEFIKKWNPVQPRTES